MTLLYLKINSCHLLMLYKFINSNIISAMIEYIRCEGKAHWNHLNASLPTSTDNTCITGYMADIGQCRSIAQGKYVIIWYFSHKQPGGAPGKAQTCLLISAISSGPL